MNTRGKIAIVIAILLLATGIFFLIKGIAYKRSEYPPKMSAPENQYQEMAHGYIRYTVIEIEGHRIAVFWNTWDHSTEAVLLK